jgi:hypothetical protein
MTISRSEIQPAQGQAAAIDPRAGLREFIFENAGYAVVEAEIVQRQAQLDDGPGMNYAARRLIAYVRAIAQACKEINEAQTLEGAE